MSKAELRARILATANPKPFPLDIEEWGDVYVKPLLVGELEAISDDVDPKLRTARGVARVLCDKHGELIFDPNSTEDLFAINGLRSDSLNKIQDAMEKVNPRSDEAVIDLGNVSLAGTNSSST